MLQEESLSRKRRSRHPGLSQSTPGSVARPGRSIGLVSWVSVMQGAQVAARRMWQGKFWPIGQARKEGGWGRTGHHAETAGKGGRSQNGWGGGAWRYGHNPVHYLRVWSPTGGMEKRKI